MMEDATDRSQGESSVPLAPRRLIVADDHGLVREGLRTLLTPPHCVAGLAASGAELLDLLQTTRADCLLLDLAMPGTHGLELIPTIRGRYPDLKILVVTMYLDRGLAEECLRRGAHGFIPKDAGLNEILLAIDAVVSGRRYVSPRVPKTSHRMSLQAQHVALARLTPRQYEVVRGIGECKKESRVARELSLNRCTVWFHKRRAMKTLGIATNESLVRFAVLLGEGDGPES